MKKCRTECKLLAGIKGLKDTCYLDTVLFALLSFPTQIVRNSILTKDVSKIGGTICSKSKEKEKKIRKLLQLFLRKAYELIQEGTWKTNTHKIKKLIGKCDDYVYAKSFSEYIQEDSKDFLEFILDLFGVKGVLQSVPVSKLSNNISLGKIIKPPKKGYAIIHLDRVYDTDKGKRRKRRYAIKPILKLGKLKLSHIICHYGRTTDKGHYICYFKCGNEWLLYDNSKRGFNVIGDSIKGNERIEKDSILYFFS